MSLETASYMHPVCALLIPYVFTDVMKLTTKINHHSRQVAVYLEWPSSRPSFYKKEEKEQLHSYHHGLLSKLHKWARFWLVGRDTVSHSTRASAQ